MIDNATELGSLTTVTERRLSRAEFQGLGEMPPELEWFANLDNPRTRRAYRIDVKELTAFAGVGRPEEMRQSYPCPLDRLAQRPRMHSVDLTGVALRRRKIFQNALHNASVTVIMEVLLGQAYSPLHDPEEEM